MYKKDVNIREYIMLNRAITKYDITRHAINAMIKDMDLDYTRVGLWKESYKRIYLNEESLRLLIKKVYGRVL